MTGSAAGAVTLSHHSRGVSEFRIAQEISFVSGCELRGA